MCQQTQIATVLPYYARWMRQFPDWAALARATESSVLKHWEGLGYYNRARNLHRLARTIHHDLCDELPRTLEGLQALPGIGPYTAGAILSIACNQRAAVLDGNVERVLTRVFDLPWNVADSATKKMLWQICEQLLPQSGFGDHNQSLMELGALICTPNSPQCLLCPLQSICRSPDPESRPVKKRTVITREKEQVAILLQNKKIWLLNPSETGRWKGFHRLPLFDATRMTRKSSLGRVNYSITRYRVEAEVWQARWKKSAARNGDWLPLQALEKISMPSPHRKMLSLIPALLSSEVSVKERQPK